MYLTKIVLNIHNKNLCNLVGNVNELHKLVMSGFEDVESETPRYDLGILYEIKYSKKGVCVIVQSLEKPDYSCQMEKNQISFIQQKQIDRLLDSIVPEKFLVVEVLSEPYKKVKNLDSKNSRRKVLTNEEEKKEWFKRKITNYGCRVLVSDVTKPERTLFGIKKNMKFTYRPSKYKAVVEITDAEKFKEIIRAGIGSGKAYGMGMVKVFPYNPIM